MDDDDLVRWFCSWCGETILARRSDDPRHRPVWGCRRPDGFGRWAREAELAQNLPISTSAA